MFKVVLVTKNTAMMALVLIAQQFMTGALEGLMPINVSMSILRCPRVDFKETQKVESWKIQTLRPSYLTWNLTFLYRWNLSFTLRKDIPVIFFFWTHFLKLRIFTFAGPGFLEICRFMWFWENTESQWSDFSEVVRGHAHVLRHGVVEGPLTTQEICMARIAWYLGVTNLEVDFHIHMLLNIIDAKLLMLLFGVDVDDLGG